MKAQFAFPFFDQPGGAVVVKACPLDLPEADVVFYAGVFSPGESAQLFDDLQTAVAWTQERLTLYGQDRLPPRLTAWYGDEGAKYTYSHITMQPHPWTATLREACA
jgi:alkylated DNA repair dioxygenase AlkB